MKKPTVAERRNEILETTCEVVIERGFAGTRIADVAKRLDVSSSLIHYHFDSKEQLLAEAFAHYANKDVAEMEGEIENAPTALGKLERVIQNYVPEGSDDVEWMLWIDGWGEALRNPMMKKISQQLDEQSTELLGADHSHRRRVRRVHLPRPDRVARCASPRSVDGSGGAVRRPRRDDESRSADRPRPLRRRRGGRRRRRRVQRSPSDSPTVQRAIRRHRRCAAAARQQLLRRASTAATSPRGRRRGPTTRRGPRRTKPVIGRRAIVADVRTERSAETDWVVQSAPLMVFEVDEAHGAGTGRVTVHERFKKRKSAKPGTHAGDLPRPIRAPRRRDGCSPIAASR